MGTEIICNQNEMLSTGARLKDAREQLGLSQQKVAERLCLKVSIIRDIEEDKVPTDLASIFLRGYVRSYAKLVHIPEEELLPIIEKQMPIKIAKATLMQDLLLNKRRRRYDCWLMSFSWLTLFVLVGLTGAWWWQNHKEQQEDITAIGNQSSIELNQPNNDNQNIPLNNDDSLSTREPPILHLQPNTSIAPPSTSLKKQSPDMQKKSMHNQKSIIKHLHTKIKTTHAILKKQQISMIYYI